MTAENPMDTLPDLSDGLLALYDERRALQGRIDHIKGILLAESIKGIDQSAEPPFRYGTIIEGKKAKWRAVPHMKESGNPYDWEPKLERYRG